ncbi:MAG: hypothetical protein ACXWL2_04845 [Candidatus Chromulinivorax sp.]
MKKLQLILALFSFGVTTNVVYTNPDDLINKMIHDMNLWRKQPELHPNVVKATECRKAITDGTANLECQEVMKYFDLCKESNTGLDNYYRALVAAQYDLSIEECQKYNEKMLQLHKGMIDNSSSEEVAVLIKAEKISDPEIIKLAIVVEYFLLHGNNYKDYQKMVQIREELEKKMKIKPKYF